MSEESNNNNSNANTETGNSTTFQFAIPEEAILAARRTVPTIPIPRPTGLNRKRKVEFTLPPAKEPALAPEPTSITTIDTNALSTATQELAASTPQPTQTAATTSTRTSNETMSRRPNDIVYQLHEPPNEFMPPSLEPSDAAFKVPAATAAAAKQDESLDDASASLSNVLPMKSYNKAQRFLIQTSLNAANFAVGRETSNGIPS
jgi:hypothetical protein